MFYKLVKSHTNQTLILKACCILQLPSQAQHFLYGLQRAPDFISLLFKQINFFNLTNFLYKEADTFSVCKKTLLELETPYTHQ